MSSDLIYIRNIEDVDNRGNLTIGKIINQRSSKLEIKFSKGHYLEKGQKVKVDFAHFKRGVLSYSGIITQFDPPNILISDLKLLSKQQRRNERRHKFLEDTFIETNEVVVENGLQQEPKILPKFVRFKVENISAAGIMLRSELDIQNTINLMIPLNFIGIDEIMFTKIMRKESKEGNSLSENGIDKKKYFYYGCRFVYIGEKTKEDIRKYICENERLSVFANS